MNRKLKIFIIWPLVAIFLLLLCLRLALAPIAKFSINDWFEQQGIDSSIEDISFEVSDGRLSLTNLTANNNGSRVLALEQARLGWSWSALLDQQVKLNLIDIAGVAFDVERGPGERLVIAGIDLNKLSATDEQAPEDKTESEPVEWTIMLQQLKLDDFRLCYLALPQHDYCNEFETLSWNGNIELDLARLSESALPLKVAGDFRLSNLKIQNNQLKRKLLGLGDFSMRQINIDTTDNISIGTTELEALTAFERAAETSQAQITRLEKIEVNQLRLTQMSHLDISEINVKDHEAILVNLSSKKLEIDEWLAAFTTEATESEAAATSESSTPFSFAIGKLRYLTDKSLEYQDLSFEKPFAANLNSIELTIENLDSRKPEQKSRLNYSAKYAEHGLINVEGDITPLDKKQSFDLSGRIEGLDLRDLSPFTANAIGHDVKSGQLDADLKLKADNNLLDSEVDLTLHQFNLVALSAADQEKIDASFGFPLNTSLSLLKDRDNTIKLNIPITGDLQNPDFDPNDAITQATSSAITAAVLNYYTPFGLVTLVDGLFSLATALKFEPVEFASGVSNITPANNAGLEKIIALMQDRPGIVVTLCAFTNSADRVLLLPETAEIAADELKLEDEQGAKLSELGEARAAAVKDLLVKAQIDAARLVLCASEHVEGEGLAGVEISI
jgi:outer membrane protein OmpA-like peptidoglycan-associated protein